MSKLDEVDFVKKIYPVYKAIKKFEDQGLVSLMQSNDDKREVYLDLLLA